MQITDALIIGVIVGLISLFKKLGLPSKYAPLASLALGIVGGTIYLYPNDIKTGVLMGIIVGLSGVGLYSGAKNAIKKGE